ncbi:MAG TPA: lysophospholipid acyltransferase family protein [Propionibacteriaceae bacterium]
MAETPAVSRQTVLRPLSEANHEPGAQTISTVVSLLHAIMRPLTKRDWRGQDKVPQTGGVIFVANHISNADPLAVGQFLAFSGRWPRFLAKASVFQIPVIGRIIAACGQIPVQRGSAESRDALTVAAQAIEQGRALVIYPEGTITYDPGLWPMKGKTGAARLAFETDCPLIPIGQWGAQELMPGRKPGFPKLFPRKTLRVAAGDPVSLDDLRSKSVSAATLDEATRRVMDAITVLVAELRQATPPAHRYDPRTDMTTGDQR